MQFCFAGRALPLSRGREHTHSTNCAWCTGDTGRLVKPNEGPRRNQFLLQWSSDSNKSSRPSETRATVKHYDAQSQTTTIAAPLYGAQFLEEVAVIISSIARSEGAASFRRKSPSFKNYSLAHPGVWSEGPNMFEYNSPTQCGTAYGPHRPRDSASSKQVRPSLDPTPDCYNIYQID